MTLFLPRISRPLQMLLVVSGLGALFAAGLAIRSLVDERAGPPAPAASNTTPARALLLARAPTAEVIASLQSQLREHPDDVNSLTLLAQAYIQQTRENGDPGNYVRAEKALQRALKLSPQNVDALNAKATLQFARHQFKESLDLAQRSRTLNPNKAATYGIVGDDQIELGRYDEAIQTYQAMVNLRPDMASYSRVSYARELYGDIPGAIAAMQQAITAGGPNAEGVAWSQVYLGNLYLNYTGDLDAAARAYQQALAAFPDYVHALAGMAAISAVRGDNDQAISQYTRVVELIPLPQYLIALGDLQQLTGRSAEAQRTYALVRTEEKLYQTSGVDMDLDIALFDADHGIDLQQGLERARRVFRARPSVTAADVLAWTLYKTGHLDEAASTAQQALRLSKANALFLFHAGMIASARGQKQEAIDDLQRALATNAAASSQPYLEVLYGQAARAELAKLHREPAEPMQGGN